MHRRGSCYCLVCSPTCKKHWRDRNAATEPWRRRLDLTAQCGIAMCHFVFWFGIQSFGRMAQEKLLIYRCITSWRPNLYWRRVIPCQRLDTFQSDKSLFSSLNPAKLGTLYLTPAHVYSRCFCPSNWSKVIHGSGSIVKHNPIWGTQHFPSIHPWTFDSSRTQKDNQQYFRGTTTLA